MPTAYYQASHYMIFGPTTRTDKEVDTSFYVADGSVSVDLNEKTFWFDSTFVARRSLTEKSGR